MSVKARGNLFFAVVMIEILFLIFWLSSVFRLAPAKRALDDGLIINEKYVRLSGSPLESPARRRLGCQIPARGQSL